MPQMPSYTCILPWVHAGPVDFSNSFYDCISTQPHRIFVRVLGIPSIVRNSVNSKAADALHLHRGSPSGAWVVYNMGWSFSAIWQPGIGVSVRRYWAVPCGLSHAAASFVCSLLVNGAVSLYRNWHCERSRGVRVVQAAPRGQRLLRSCQGRQRSEAIVRGRRRAAVRGSSSSSSWRRRRA